MLDTIVISGPASLYKFKADYTKFTVFRKEGMDDYIPMVAVENRKSLVDGRSLFRIFYDPGTDTIRVEASIPKLIFTNNFYNYYVNDSNACVSLIRNFASYFFTNGDFYVNRLDVGGLVTFRDPHAASLAVDSFRRSRLQGSRVKKFKHQNYEESVFYSSKNYSVKIYNKGLEFGRDNSKNFLDFDLLSTLRFEKTYRAGSWKKLCPTKSVVWEDINDNLIDVSKYISLNPGISPGFVSGAFVEKTTYQGMNVQPFKGVHIDEFRLDLIFRDFYDTFINWDMFVSPVNTNLKGTQGLLAVIHNQGLLSDVEAKGIVNRSTIYRYRKAIKENFKTPTIQFVENLSSVERNKLYYCSLYGFTSFLT